MATSNVSIANLGLQKLGAARIVSLDENSRNAREMNACFEALRDTELRKYLWKFALTRTTLAPDATAPAFTYGFAFPVPTDFLRLVKPARLGLDWHLEQHQGRLCILTNDGDTLEVRYLARVTDPALFDSCFVEMLACKLAWNVCESLTQSNTKKAAILEEYQAHQADARRSNAFELARSPEPTDEWLDGREVGQLRNTEWGEE